MYLYPEHKIASVHLIKTAGSAMRIYLCNVLYDGEWLYKILFPEHAALKYKYHLIPEDYNIIAPIRNPYRRMVSNYCFNKAKGHPLGNEGPYWNQRGNNARNMDFKTWFLKDFMPDFRAGDMHTQPIIDGIEVGGKIPANVTTVRVEYLQEDIDKFFDKVGIVTDEKIPIVNATSKTHMHKSCWQEYYDDIELRDMVYEWDRRTFETFGYDKEIKYDIK